jgi:glycosyltransferase involved in cell wall biosynthesis
MEGIPVAIMEAFACGLPVVATALSGVPELVRTGDTGYLVEPANPVALADSLTDVYNNPNKAAQYARAGRMLVLAEFDLNTNVQRLAHCFDECVAVGSSNQRAAASIE